MPRPIDDLIARVRSVLPNVRVDQLRVKHAADDDNVWYFQVPGREEVQVDSYINGEPPFLVESAAPGRRVEVIDFAEAADLVLAWLANQEGPATA